MAIGRTNTGGGGGGVKVIVHAPTGSTVTCSKDGKTKTASEKNGTWEFKGLDVGTWTITGTLGESTATHEIVIENPEVTLSYGVYLYFEGDTCEAVTGGYYAAGLKPTSNSASNGLPTITYGEETMTITGSNTYNYNGGYVRTKNKIDLTDFSKLVFEGNRTGSGGAEMVVWTDIGSYILEKAVKHVEIPVGATSAEIDVSDLTGEHYIGFMTTKNGDGAAVITVMTLGLE